MATFGSAAGPLLLGAAAALSCGVLISGWPRRAFVVGPAR
jgi:hypothetical protein